MAAEREITPEMFGRIMHILWEYGACRVRKICAQYHLRYLSPTAYTLVPEALRKMKDAELVDRESGWRSWRLRLRRQRKHPNWGLYRPRDSARLYWAVVSEEELRQALARGDSEDARRFLAALDEPEVWRKS